MTENHKLPADPKRPVEKRTNPLKNAALEPMQQTERLLRKGDRQDKVKNIVVIDTTQDFLHFYHLMMHGKNEASKTSPKP